MTNAEQNAKRSLAMPGILLVAFGLRLAWTLHLRHETTLFGDGSLYDYFARGFLSGDYPEDAVGFRSMVAPGYPAFVALIYKLVGHISYNAVRIVQCLLGTAAVWLFAQIAERLFNRRVALWSAAVMAVYPFAIFYPATLMSETLFLFLVALNVLGVLVLKDAPTVGKAALVGVVAGLAVLTRPQHLLFVGAAGLFLLWTADRSRAVVQRLLVPAAFGIACFAAVVPWTIRNFRHYHEVVLVSDNGTDVLWWGNNPISSAMYLTNDPAEFHRLDAEIWGPEGERVLRRRGRTLAQKKADVTALVVAYIENNPGEWAHVEALKLVSFWRPWLSGGNSRAQSAISLLTYGPILLLGLPFLIWCTRRGSPNTAASRLLLAVCVIHTGVALVFVALSRYRFPVIDPYLAIYACAAVDLALERRGRAAVA